jgi:serine protease Do
LGVSIVDVTEEISETYGLPIGVYVSAVDAGYGADKAGIKQEDVITAVNGKTVTTGTELKQYLSKYAVGETVTVTVSRADGKEYKSKDIEVTLSENPNAEAN